MKRVLNYLRTFITTIRRFLLFWYSTNLTVTPVPVGPREGNGSRVKAKTKEFA
jgi:hypothetical protein